jgi:hypothetical protein
MMEMTNRGVEFAKAIQNYSSWSEERKTEELEYQAGYNKEARNAVKQMKRAGAILQNPRSRPPSSSRSSDALPDTW